MNVIILGNNSALPGFGRHPTSQAVHVNNAMLLIDCGEGTQVQMQRYGVKWGKLKHIFISHLHGDHYFGLPGLLNSMSLMGRTDRLHLHGPAMLKQLLDTIMDVADTVFSFELIFHELPEEGGRIVDDPGYSVTCFPVEHRIKCHGFLVVTKTRGRKILPEKCLEHNIPHHFYDNLKSGEDYTCEDGTIVPNTELTTIGPPSRSYAYCADTLYTESFMPYIKGVDTMYHESTYLHDDLEKAVQRFHTTARQAAELALKAGVKQLLLGHFSSKYKDLSPFQEEASAIFPNVKVTTEGMSYDV